MNSFWRSVWMTVWVASSIYLCCSFVVHSWVVDCVVSTASVSLLIHLPRVRCLVCHVLYESLVLDV